MSEVREPEVMSAETGTDLETVQPPGAMAMESNSLLANAMQVQGISMEERLMLLDKIESIFVARRKAEAEAKFFEARALFQSRVPKIPKTKKGYGYLYAPLGVIEDKIQGAMQYAGLSKAWRQEETPETVKVVCMVSHIGGHSIENPLGPVPWDLLEKTDRMNSLQHRAALLTYLQRYTLIGALGLATADDDPDGIIPEEARTQQREQSRQPVSQPQQKPTAKRAADAKAAGEKLQLEPAAEGEAIDSATVKGLQKAMEHAALGHADLIKRFPALSSLENVKKTDSRVVMSWIADPIKN